MKSSLSKNQGFTLIELIVVIVILGIMAAIAGPKFVDLQTDARISVIKGVEGSLRSAATLVYSKALIEGKEKSATETVTVSGSTVTIAYGYPTANAAGIGVAVDTSGDITHDGSGGYSLRTNCSVSYTAATSAVVPAVVAAPVTTGC